MSLKLALLGLLLALLVALVVDRRLRQARDAREEWLAYEAQREAQRMLERNVAARLREADAKRNRELEARSQVPAGNGRSTRSYAVPLPAPPRAVPSSRAPCSTQQPHHYLSGGVYDPAGCGGSSWNSSSDSCSSPSDSGGGGGGGE